MKSIGTRLDALERLRGQDRPPFFLIIGCPHCRPTEEEVEAAEDEALRESPVQRFFVLRVCRCKERAYAPHDRP